MAGSVTLNALEIQVQPEIERSESDLKSVLDTIKSGGEVDAAKLLYYTTEVNKNSLTINMFSSIVKERGDTLKGACQKLS